MEKKLLKEVVGDNKKKPIKETKESSKKLLNEDNSK